MILYSYILGFVEAFGSAFSKYGVPQGYWWDILYGSVALIILSIICYIGANFFSKANFLIFIALMVAIVFSIASLLFQRVGVIPGYTGWKWKTFVENLKPDFGKTDPSQADTWSPRGTFGILFSACTGIMAGVNM